MGILDNLGDWINRRMGRPAPATPTAGAPAPTAATVAVPVATRPPAGRWKLLAVGFGVVVIAFFMTAPKQQGSTLAPTLQGGFTPTDETSIARAHPIPKQQASLRPNPDLSLIAQDNALRGAPTSGMPPGYGVQPTPGTDPLAQEKERLRKSLFASPVVSVAEEPVLLAMANPPPASPSPAVAAVAPGAGSSASLAPTVAAREKPSDSHRKDCKDVISVEPDGENQYALCEGTLIPLVLNNRLTGDFTGPVVATVSDELYSRDRQHLLLPKGTRVLGRAEKVGEANQQRLVVKFHRILFPNGRGYVLEAPGLDEAGDAALKADKINRHLLATFSTSVAMAALAGFAQAGTGSYLNASGMDMYRQGFAQNLSMQATQQANQNMGRRMPTIEVDEGHPIKLFLEEDLLVPEYMDVPTMSTSFGGK